MKNITTYINEKLVLNKDNVKDYANDYTYYFNCDVDFTDEIDEWCKNTNIQAQSLFSRKIDRGANKGKNHLWYAVYCYLYMNGPAKWKDIISVLKPDSKAQYAELGTEMRGANIIKSKNGYQVCQDPKDWIRFNK